MLTLRAFTMDSDEGGMSEQVEACLNLWAHKFITHKKDYGFKNFTRQPLAVNIGQQTYKNAAPPEQAEFWFFIDPSIAPGSMRWVCSLFGVDVDRVRTNIQPLWRELYGDIKPMGFEATSEEALQIAPFATTVVKKNRASFVYK